MMGIASEIREAIVKRGGTPPSHGGIAASLDVLNKLNSGGGGSGGGGNFVVNVVVGEDMASIASADKTYDEILNAFSSGVIPFAKVLLPEASGSMCLAAPMGMFNPGGYQCTFMCPTPFGNFTVTVENNDAWSLTTPE